MVGQLGAKRIFNIVFIPVDSTLKAEDLPDTYGLVYKTSIPASTQIGLNEAVATLNAMVWTLGQPGRQVEYRAQRKSIKD